ncbi:hypothetical protein A2246_03500 [candidate division WOR-1 bacterium RIFOXYA2_FULL_37_7]|nr:MAG: hypothetical protein A2246_03500 [candidate division WOR-1 bacterium RIFOXYA2_FULL_37_7]
MDIHELKNEEVDSILKWIQQEKVLVYDKSYQCETRDVFKAKLDNFYAETKDPLLTAVIGEIGNNSFDHNLGSWTDVVGLLLEVLSAEKLVILADRGQGIRASLSRIIPEIKSDKEALEIAFTKVISGRSPEQRGNGLKFVSSAMQNNGFSLWFQSGTGAVSISNKEIKFFENSFNIKGCIAIIKY